MLYSPIHTLNALTGALVNTGTLFVLGVNESTIANGVLGWNSTLICNITCHSYPILTIIEFIRFNVSRVLQAQFDVVDLCHLRLAPDDLAAREHCANVRGNRPT